MKKKGILSFLFSFNGKISKELYMGAILPLMALFSLIAIAPANPAQKVLNVLFSVLFIISIFMVMAVSFKRAHSLGVSGIYSIASEYFLPFFAFFKPEREFSNDMIYKGHFTKLKKIGYFFDRNILTRIIYIALMVFFATVCIMKENINKNNYWIFYGIVVLINLVQLFLIKFKFIRRYYTPVVKVLSFLLLVCVFIGIGFIVGYAAGIDAVLKAMAAGK